MDTRPCLEVNSREYKCISCGNNNGQLYRDFNSGIIKIEHCGHWKLVAILLLCDAFTKLLLDGSDSGESHLGPDYMIYSALEWGLYHNFSLALIELISTVSVIILYIRIASAEKYRPVELMRGILLSNFGKILVIPAVLWGTNYSLIYVSLSRMFVCAANIQVIRVLCPDCHISTCVVSVVLGHVIAMAASLYIPHVFSQM